MVAPAAGAQESAAGSRPVYFEDTGQVLSGVFLDTWFEHGGPDRTGHPVSPAIRIGDRWVQWFEYARFEVTAEEYQSAAVDDVESTAIGSAYADRIGYSRQHPAFSRVGGAARGALYFAESGHTLANAFLDAYDESTSADSYGMPISEEFAINGTTYQFFEHGAMSWTPETGAVRVPVGTLDAMLHGTLGRPAERPEDADVYSPDLFALRGHYPGERWIEINTSTHVLTAWDGDTPVMRTMSVTGAPVSPTVSGEFRIYVKISSQRMRGINGYGVSYDYENVPNVMYFYEDWGIHGAYWRSSFGFAGSAGCVNLPLGEAAWLFEWASVGTRVVVH